VSLGVPACNALYVYLKTTYACVDKTVFLPSYLTTSTTSTTTTTEKATTTEQVSCTDKKGKRNFPQNSDGISCKVILYMRKGFLIYKERRKYLTEYQEPLVIYDFATDPF
jgi:hypothetical protein